MPNRLAQESSPYLLQHAGNPVDWHAWNDEALERARAEDRPILLSIGYSACHWCHVMERESFEDPEVADLMNAAFVNIKVDREERPDIDSIYMRAVQAITGQGGWPLTAFLTPEGVPFYGGTYFPPEPRHGMPSFRQVLQAAGSAFRDRRDEVTEGAEQIRTLLERSMGGVAEPGKAGMTAGGEPATGDENGGPASLSPELLAQAQRGLAAGFDPVHGGFGGAPRFPQPLALDFALRSHVRTGDAQTLEMVTHTLRKMARGGIHDQLGGGFHRYSVDERWLVPHFEKMLYDNALLARVYLHAWLVTGDNELGEVAERTLDYVLADLRSPEGGFFSARDADSEGEEGTFYLWSAEEIDALLAPDDARLFRHAFDVSAGGNFEGRNILHLPHDLDAIARSENVAVEALRERLRAAGDVLLEARAKREHPFRDEKILTGWNGLVLHALAEAGAALGREEYVEAASRGADFILGALRRDGRLLHSWKDGDARIPGFLDDYGAMGHALLALHEATLEPRWLKEAGWMAARIVELFRGEEDGVFYDTAEDAEKLVVRPREVMDNPTPSGTSLAADLLLRLGRLREDERYLRLGAAALARESSTMTRFPSAFGRLLSALDFHLAKPVELVLVGEPQDERTRALLDTVHARHLPNRLVLGWRPGDELAFATPLLEGREARGGGPTAYLCEGYACRAPTGDPEALAEQLDAIGAGAGTGAVRGTGGGSRPAG